MDETPPPVSPTPCDSPPAADYSIPGMRIQAGGPQAAWALVVRTAARQPQWVLEPLSAADRNSLMVTPTTLLYQGRPYRIHEEEAAESGWIYRMQPCHDGETQLQVVALARENVVQGAADRQEFQKIQALAHHSAVYEILLGWLPARWQEDLSQRWHFSPADATRKNGMAELLIGFGLIAPVLRYHGPSAAMVPCLAAFEGTVRWFTGLLGEQPLGILPLELAERAVRLVSVMAGKVRR